MDGGRALAAPAVEIVLLPDANVQAHGDSHRAQRIDVPHQPLDRQHGILRNAVDEFHEIARIGPVVAAPDRDPVEDVGSHILPLADDALDRLEVLD